MEKERVYEVVKKVVMEIIPELDPETVSINKSLKELGANSIDRMEVVTMAMEELELKLPLMHFAQISNIEGLVDVLAKNSN